MPLLAFMLFLTGAIIAVTFVLLKYHREPKTKSVVCPETKLPAEVELDNRHAVLTLLRNKKELKLKDCSRWPQRADCEEDCLVQFGFGPRTEAALAKWSSGKKCALCATPITRTDWQRGRAAALDSNHALIELRDMDWKQFPMILDAYEPLCLRCHETELLERQLPRIASEAHV